jgi:hypothetical protein
MIETTSELENRSEGGVRDARIACLCTKAVPRGFQVRFTSETRSFCVVPVKSSYVCAGYSPCSKRGRVSLDSSLSPDAKTRT